MTVELSFDLMLNLHFYFTGRFPVELIDEIGQHKYEVYASLSEDLARPDILVGSRQFVASGRKFDVSFASDQRQVDFSSDLHPLRVTDIVEVH